MVDFLCGTTGFETRCDRNNIRANVISANVLPVTVDLRQLFDDLVRFETDLWNGVDARLRQAGAVPLGSLNVLQVVARTEACRVNDIADALSITIGGASQAVDRSTARGLLARRPNPGDRRSSIVELTPAGADAL